MSQLSEFERLLNQGFLLKAAVNNHRQAHVLLESTRKFHVDARSILPAPIHEPVRETIRQSIQQRCACGCLAAQMPSGIEKYLYLVRRKSTRRIARVWKSIAGYDVQVIDLFAQAVRVLQHLRFVVAEPLFAPVSGPGEAKERKLKRAVVEVGRREPNADQVVSANAGAYSIDRFLQERESAGPGRHPIRLFCG